MQEDTMRIPVVALRGLVLYPNTSINFDVGRRKSLAALNKVMESDQLLCLVTQTNADQEDPGAQDLSATGTLGLVKQVLRLPNDTVRVLVEGLDRAAVQAYTGEEDYLEADIALLKETDGVDSLETEATMRSLMGYFEEYAQISGHVSPETLLKASVTAQPGRLADLVASHALTRLEDKLEVLDISAPADRLNRVLMLLAREVDVQRIEQTINQRVRKQIDTMQKEHYLHEQIRAIQKELGQDDDSEFGTLRGKINALPVSEEVREKCVKELERLQRQPGSSPDTAVLRTWLEWVTELPWLESTEDNMDLKNAQAILNEDHYGLEKVKERVIEYLAVRGMTHTMKGPILCFVGPPGVGKTSIARSIARALGRRFVRMSLGGVHDEAEIRGHRRTYIGAIPGRILANIRQAKTNNPLFLFDEVDKIGSDFRGDPSSALLEVLDTEQNNTFQDHYLEIPFDLSRVMFVATANTVDTIPPPLLDRMEIIRIAGYTDEEKIHICRRHLIPKQMKEHGLAPEMMSITRDALLMMIEGYTREAGVRGIEREIANCCRKAARQIMEGGRRPVRVTRANLEKYLGVPRFHRNAYERKNAVGMVTGLAWTAVGGVTLEIEAGTMPGSGQLELTGQLGDVMKESARAALSYIRARSGELGIDPAFNKTTDIHIHIPEGAIPKDGPSAGVTMATALASALSGRPARGDLAMTGEITLRGQVLPIGGVKEKVLAAYREGIRTVILPKDNERNVYEISDNIRRKMEFVFVENVEQVLNLALEAGEESHRD